MKRAKSSPKVIEELPHGARVLLIRIRSLGDSVLTTPAISLLKQARPDVFAGVVVEQRFAEVYEGNPNVDKILPPQTSAVARFRADLCLNLHGGTRSMTLTAISRARWRAGFAHHRGAWIYNVRIPRAQEILGVERKVHTAEHLASAIFYLGAPVSEIPPARLYAEPSPSTRPYAVLHPAASAPDKTWPAERFVELARHLESNLALEAVFIGGARDQLTPFAAFRQEQGAPLGRVKSLLAGASLFIGNDSGPAHMAAALGRPVVVVFGNSDPVVWAPWKAAAESIVAPGPIQDVPVSQVVAALERLRVKA